MTNIQLAVSIRICVRVVSRGNRDIKKNGQDKFICVSCGFGERFYVNSDWNAARNLSILNIDEIIKNRLEYQEKYEKNAKKHLT